MKILAADTALGACSVAILDGNTTLAHRWVAMSRGHAEALAPMVGDAMREAKLAFPKLERLAVTTGPGTFTGQRVGLAFMRGLRLATGKSLTGVTTLQAMADAASAEAAGLPVAVLHDARRGDVYGALFAGARELIPAKVAEFESVLDALEAAASGPLALAGTAAEAAAVRLTERGRAVRLTAVRQPDALWVARRALRLPEPAEPPRPFYLRAPDAKLAQAAIRTRPARREDSALLSTLHAASMPRAWDAGFFEQALGEQGGFGAVAEANGMAMGFVLARAVADEAEILAIGVLEAFRRNGLGRRLLRDAAAQASARGALAMFLEVADDNLAGRMLYAAHGFRVVGTRRNYYGADGGGDAFVLRAALPLEIPGLGNDPKVA